MAEGPSSSTSIGTILGLVIEVIVLIVVMGMVASEVTYLATMAHLQEAKILASTIAGMITAVSAAPQAGLYCVSIPATLGYDVAIGSAKLDNVGSALELRDVPDLSPWCPVSALPYADAEGVPYIQEFKAAADKYDVPVAALLAVGQLESGLQHYEPDGMTVKVSPTGAVGIMQILDGPTELAANIDRGAKEFRSKMDYFDGDVQAAFAAYSGGNAGAAEQIDLAGREIWIESILAFSSLRTHLYNDVKTYGSCSCMSADEYLAGTMPPFPGGLTYTAERQNACEVKRGTEYARGFEALGLGSVKYGFVAAIKKEGRSGGVSYMPVSNIDSQVIRVPVGQKYTLLAKKALVPRLSGGYEEKIVLRLRKGGLAQAGCNVDTPSICIY